MGGKEQNSPIYISRIIPGGVADRHGGLKRGDQLLSVNGVSVEGEHHEKAVELLKAAPSSVKLVVRYTPKVLLKFWNNHDNCSHDIKLSWEIFRYFCSKLTVWLQGENKIKGNYSMIVSAEFKVYMHQRDSKNNNFLSLGFRRNGNEIWQTKASKAAASLFLSLLFKLLVQ